MHSLELLTQLHRPSSAKIILLVLDGLGGLPMQSGGATALEAAATPNLDRLAQEGTTGQTIPILRGVTAGSGPAHLALFGYDPLKYDVGRGVLEATGVGLQVARGDVAARGNFCTLDSDGLITDRRAGRLPSEAAAPLVEQLDSIEIPGYTFEIRHVREYRFALVARGEGLESDLADTDPQQVGLAPLEVIPEKSQSQASAELFNQWIDASRSLLAREPQANGLTLRGFSTNPELPQFGPSYGLNAVCVAVYPMYKGTAKLVGMEILEFEGEDPADEFSALGPRWEDFDFAFIHVKATDSRGEDGDFEGKAAVIETVDRELGRLMDLEPAVLAVTGDHSTPARMRSHSWHPVPLLLWAPDSVRPDDSHSFGERVCANGGLGTFPAKSLMALLLAHAGRLNKFGA
ncbi:MAG: 2,3-bisphosphoglycerate-independent phosphoglycerate mutase [Anaerolineae bacterium]|nr:MAG: 2,3-bisphosphoglycerate-independent phosphoglycerate mutase [Anaerolineae bacterium]